MYKNFIKLDNWTVWGSKEEENYIQKYGDKIIALLVFLDQNTTNKGIAKTTIEEIITECFGLVPKAGKGKINEKTTKLLWKMQQEGLIECELALDSVKVSDMLKIKVKDTIEKDDEGNDKQFYSLEYRIYDCIMSHNCKVSNVTMLNVYCYISARLRRNKDGYGTTENTFVYGNGKYHEYVEEGARIENTFFSIEQAVVDLRIDNKTFIEAYKELEKIGLIYVINIGTVKRGSEVKRANNYYCLQKEWVKFTQEEAINYYAKDGWIVANGEESDNKKKDRIKYLKRKITQGKATDKDVKEYESFSGKKAKDITKDTKELFNPNRVSKNF